MGLIKKPTPFNVYYPSNILICPSIPNPELFHNRLRLNQLFHI